MAADVQLDTGEVQVAVRHTAGWRLVVAQPPLERGGRSRSLKVLDARLEGDTFLVSLEGRAGWSYALEVHKPNGLIVNEVVRLDGAAGDPQDGYARTAVRFSRK